MGKKAFFYNQDDCVGCKACQVACKDKNDLPIGIVFRQVQDFEVGEYPNASWYHLARTCNHCNNPACVENCPTGAMQYDPEDGTTQHDDTVCIGCQNCVKACPYGVPKYFEELKIVKKCDACLQLRGNGEEPACVAACQMRALRFGEAEDIMAEFPDAVRDLPVLPDSSQTDPCSFIGVKAAALEADPKEVFL